MTIAVSLSAAFWFCIAVMVLNVASINPRLVLVISIIGISSASVCGKSVSSFWVSWLTLCSFVGELIYAVQGVE